MTDQRHDQPAPLVERSFTAVRAVLPAVNAAAFDAQLAEIADTDTVDLAALDQFLVDWHRLAVRIARDPEDWQRVLQLAADLQSGARQPGRPMAEVLAEQMARRGIAKAPSGAVTTRPRRIT